MHLPPEFTWCKNSTRLCNSCARLLWLKNTDVCKSPVLISVAHTFTVQPSNRLTRMSTLRQRADLGYNEMNFMNSTRGLITPHLDALANTGVILKNYCEWRERVCVGVA